MYTDSNLNPDPIVNDKPYVKDLLLVDVAEELRLLCANKDVSRLILNDISGRAEFGHKKYGTYLQPNNGRDALVDAYQEALDLAVYLRSYVYESGDEENVHMLLGAIDMLYHIRLKLFERDGK